MVISKPADVRRERHMSGHLSAAVTAAAATVSERGGLSP
jgi:hypothetical protein